MSTSIDFDEYKRLKVLAAILPAALKRGVTFSAIEDLANRGANDGSFLISSTGELLGLPPSDFVEQMSTRADAVHLFATAPSKESAGDDMICGLPKADFDKLKPEVKLRLLDQHRQPSKDKSRVR